MNKKINNKIKTIIAFSIFAIFGQTSFASQEVCVPAKKTIKKVKKSNTKKIVKNKKPIKKDNSTKIENKDLKISIVGDEDFTKQINNENQLNEKLKNPIKLKDLNENDYNKVIDITREELFKSEFLVNAENVRENKFIIINKNNNHTIKTNELNFDNSFAVLATEKWGDIKVELKDLQKNNNEENLILNINDYIKKQECNSVSFYLDHKQYGPMTYNYNKSQNCKLNKFISTTGASFNQNGYVDTNLSFNNNGKKYLNVSYIKEGWNAQIKEKLYGKYNHNIFVDEKMNIYLSQPVVKNYNHYLKVDDLTVENYFKQSPFSFTADIENNKNYKSFFILKENDKILSFESFVIPENIQGK